MSVRTNQHQGSAWGGNVNHHLKYIGRHLAKNNFNFSKQNYSSKLKTRHICIKGIITMRRPRPILAFHSTLEKPEKLIMIVINTKNKKTKL